MVDKRYDYQSEREGMGKALRDIVKNNPEMRYEERARLVRTHIFCDIAESLDRIATALEKRSDR